MWLQSTIITHAYDINASIFQYMLASCSVAWTFILNAKLNANDEMMSPKNSIKIVAFFFF